ERPAGVDVGLAPQAAAAWASADRRADVEPVDPKLADVDVEAGKNRALLRARLEPGQADQRDPIRGDAGDAELVFEPRAGSPVELDVGRGQEDDVRVRDGDVVELRFAEDRAVDTADVDAQARRRFELAELVDDEAVTGRAVEEDEQRCEQEQEGDEQSEQLVEQAPAPVTPEADARRRGFGVLGDRFGHQKACPSETVTANGPSPFCRSSGKPRSTRIGPKLE